MHSLLRKTLSGAAIITAILVTLASEPLPVQAAAAIYVDTGAVDCPGAAFSDIQSAVDAAMPGSRTIHVCPGLYGGPIVIDGARNLKLIGRPGAWIIPVTLPLTTNLIDVVNSQNVTIEGFTIDGLSQLGHGSGEDYEVAINYWFSSGTISGNTIQNWHTPGWASSEEALIRGIMVGDDRNRKTTIKNNTITGFQGVGIEVREATKATVTGNTLTTAGTDPDMLAGIAVWSGYYGNTTGTISNNTISAPALISGADSYGVYLRNAAKYKVTKNTITNWSYGMMFSADCSDTYTNNLKVMSNTINGSLGGITLQADSSSGCGIDSHADKAVITKNIITSTEVSAFGIKISAQGSNPPNGMILRANVTKNTITGPFLIPIYQTHSTGSVISGRFSPNTINP